MISCFRPPWLPRILAVAMFLAFAFAPGQNTESGDKPEVNRRLEQAFGKDAKEFQMPIRLWSAQRRFLIAAGEVLVQADGRVKISPFSAAFFQETKEPGAFPEILTIRCDTAILTLDRPCTEFADLTNRTVSKAELKGRQIALFANRSKGDGIDILVTNGSLYYEEGTRKLWTDGIARFSDWRAKPPSVLRGKGMEMKLAKPKAGEEFGIVEQFVLRENTEADFVVDEHFGFLPVRAEQTQGEQAKPLKKGRACIRATKLVYDITKLTASFESPTPERKKKADFLGPEQVRLERRLDVAGKKLFDQLVCDRLDVQLRGNGGEFEVKAIKATARSGNELTLAHDSENIAAYGDYYFFENGDAKKASQAGLKGDPVCIALDGDLLKCKEVHFAAEGQPLKAVGPGRLDLRDHSDELDENRARHLEWRDKLEILSKRDGLLRTDLLKAYGNASFIDDRNQQEVRGEQIEVRVRRGRENPKKPAAGDGSK